MTQLLTNLQLRAARQVLNIGVRDLEKLLKVSKSTISKAEHGKTRDFFFKNTPALLDFFEKNKIIFPNEYSIRLDCPIKRMLLSNNECMQLTRFQLKSARCIMNLSQRSFSELVGFDKNILSRADLLDNTQFVSPSDKTIIKKIIEVFAKHGIEFYDPHSIFFKKYVDNYSNK